MKRPRLNAKVLFGSVGLLVLVAVGAWLIALNSNPAPQHRIHFEGYAEPNARHLELVEQLNLRRERATISVVLATNPLPESAWVWVQIKSGDTWTSFVGKPGQDGFAEFYPQSGEKKVVRLRLPQGSYTWRVILYTRYSRSSWLRYFDQMAWKLGYKGWLSKRLTTTTTEEYSFDP